MPEIARQTLFGKFSIEECLKKDDFNAVYIADHIFLQKKILLKVLDTQIVPDTTILERFKREAKLLARLEHKNVITVLDFGMYEQFFYISVEYFKSKNLRAVIRQNNLSAEQKLFLMQQLMEGMAYIHEHAVVHRDLKPENILVADDLTLKIGDFGLAVGLQDDYVTAKDSIVGTPCYMSPEQVRGESLTEKSDLFSLGVVLCELFTGTNPFLGKDINATFNAIVGFHEDAQFPDLTGVPAEAVFLIRNLLHQVPAARSLSIAESKSKHNAPQKKAMLLRGGRIRKTYIVPLILVCLLFVIGGVFALMKNANRGSMLSGNGIIQTGGRAGMATTKEENNSGGASDSKNVVSEQSNKVTEQEKNEPAVSTLQPQSAISPAQGSGKLFIECTPWAYVYIDSVQVETTPLKNDLVLPAGPHLLRLQHPAFPQYVSRIQVQPGQTSSIRINLDTLFGFLDCKVNPWGQIFVDGKMIGETPFQVPIKIIPGEHSVVVRNTNYPQAEYRVKIEQNKVFTLKYSFTRSIQGKEN